MCCLDFRHTAKLEIDVNVTSNTTRQSRWIKTRLCSKTRAGPFGINKCIKWLDVSFLGNLYSWINDVVTLKLLEFWTFYSILLLLLYFYHDVMRLLWFFSYFVGVLDRTTMQMKVQSAQLFNLQPVIPGTHTQSTEFIIKYSLKTVPL